MHHQRQIDRRLRMLLFAGAAFLLPVLAPAQTTWDGNNSKTGGTWSTANNWSNNKVPGNYTDVVFNDTAVNSSATSQAVNLNGDRYVDDLTITGDVAYSFSNGSSSRLYLDSSDGSASVITVNASASGSANHTITSKVRANNDVVITQNAAGKSLTFTNTFDANGYNVTFQGAGRATFGQNFSNADALTKAGSGILEFNATVATVSTLTLSGGTLLLDTGGHITGTTIHVTASTVLDFGTAGTNYLDFSNLVIDAGATLTIQNWSSSTDYFAIACNPGASTTNHIVFSQSGTFGSWYDDCDGGYIRPGATPVPEPSTYGAVILALLGGLYAWRRRPPTPSRRVQAARRRAALALAS